MHHFSDVFTVMTDDWKPDWRVEWRDRPYLFAVTLDGSNTGPYHGKEYAALFTPDEGAARDLMARLDAGGHRSNLRKWVNPHMLDGTALVTDLMGSLRFGACSLGVRRFGAGSRPHLVLLASAKLRGAEDGDGVIAMLFSPRDGGKSFHWEFSPHGAVWAAARIEKMYEPEATAMRERWASTAMKERWASYQWWGWDLCCNAEGVG